MSAGGSPASGGARDLVRDVVLPDEAATLRLGGEIAAALRRGDVVALFGDLGAGKTTFARGILQALGHTDVVPSPTFTIVQQYETAGLDVAHFDLYRLTDPGEMVELGLDEACHRGAVLIEWPEIALPVLPAHRLDLRLGGTGDTREACLTGHGDWAVRLGALAI